MPLPSPNGSAAPGRAAARQPRRPAGRRGHRGQGRWSDALRRRWGLLVGVTLAVALPVAALTFAKPDYYAAWAVVKVQRVDDAGATGALRHFGGQAPEQMANEVLILQESHALALRVARRLLAIGRAPGAEAPLAILAGAEGAGAVEAVAASLQGGYVHAASVSTGADALAITGVSTTPAEAALLANVYAEEYVAWLREAGHARQRGLSAFIEEQVETQSAEIAATNEEITGYMMREGAVGLDVRARRVVGQVARLQADLAAAELEAGLQRQTVEATERELARLASGLAPRVVTDDRALAALQARRADLRRRLDAVYHRAPELRTAPTPDVAALQREGAGLDARIGALSRELAAHDLTTGGGGPGDRTTGAWRMTDARRRLAQARAALAGQEARQAALRARLAAQETELDVIPAQAIGLGQLVRRRMSAELLRDTLRSRLVQVSVDPRHGVERAEVLRPAFVPAAPFGPNRPRDTLYGLLAGLALAAGFAFTLHRLDDVLRRPDDLQRAGYAVLPAVPRLTPRWRPGAEAARVEVAGRLYDAGLVTVMRPESPACESYRALRTALQFCRPDALVETVLVTSASPGEGKSTTAANLAVTLARAGRRTVLVDVDLRRPSVHRKLGRPRQPGLTERVFGTAPLDLDALATDVENLSVLPAGALVASPSELLGSRAFAALLASLRATFDVVVLDGPPVLAATDPVLLARLADATVLVAAAGRTRRAELHDAFAALQQAGAYVAGVVLNGVDAAHVGAAAPLSEEADGADAARPPRLRWAPPPAAPVLP